MGRRTVDTTRRMTRKLLRAHLQQQFAQLPLEIVCAIVTIAARDSISANNRQWVAQSLAVVCRIFRDAAEPVLVESVLIWRQNNSKFQNVRPGRFARTKHLYIANSVDLRAEQFPSLEALTGSIIDLQRIRLAHHNLPPRLTLRSYWDARTVAGVEPLLIETLAGVTHLRIKNYTPHGCPLEKLPASVTHLVLTLPATAWSDSHTMQLENQIRSILSSGRRHIVRVLVCVDYMQSEVAVGVLAHMRQTFPASSCDARLWVDDSNAPGLTLEEKELLDPAQTFTWYAGRPLHAPPPPP
ncbi:hypothetical protein EXIGLDRAFT_724871 [Exidia glandulosa HHB12029]|uniref:F-box domain-containing protein n=1 Tax=Exidia glandulosa HHB12029 TaxID=1314781 RepID=A0A165E8M6_EXIGL|nr:hypothetical protein EXIGLDRAFT_724871 [Exidia glandulosa HHB12029]